MSGSTVYDAQSRQRSKGIELFIGPARGESIDWVKGSKYNPDRPGLFQSDGDDRRLVDPPPRLSVNKSGGDTLQVRLSFRDIMRRFFLGIVRYVNKSLSGRLSDSKMANMADEIATIFEKEGLAASPSQVDRMTSGFKSFADRQQPILPDAAPELYDTKKGDPVSFYWRVWGKYAKDGVLYQFDLRRRDPVLYRKLHDYCHYREIDLSEALDLPRQASYTEKQAAKEELDVSGIRAKKALSQRKFRARHRDDLGRS